MTVWDGIVLALFVARIATTVVTTLNALPPPPELP